MLLLTLGVLLWMGTHLVPSVAPGLKQSLVDKAGFNGYRGIFSLAILSSMALIVFGWRSAQPVSVYLPPAGLREVAIVGTVIAFILMAASGRPTRIGRVVRHPQLTGVLVWALSHLLANGDSRSLVLFGGFALWSLLEIILISKREGPWQKPEAPALSKDIVGVVIGLVIAVAVVWAHPWIAGVPIR